MDYEEHFKNWREDQNRAQREQQARDEERQQRLSEAYPRMHAIFNGIIRPALELVATGARPAGLAPKVSIQDKEVGIKSGSGTRFIEVIHLAQLTLQVGDTGYTLEISGDPSNETMTFNRINVRDSSQVVSFDKVTEDFVQDYLNSFVLQFFPKKNGTP